MKSAQLAAMWCTCNAFDSGSGQNCLSWITPTFPSEAQSSGESVITTERGGFHHAVCMFVMVCVREPQGGLAARHGGCVWERMNTRDGDDTPSCVVHTFPGQFTKSLWPPFFFSATATGPIWLKSCNKSARLSWKSPSSVMAEWSPAMVCVCVYVCVCVCVCLHACSSSTEPWPTGALLSDWRLAGELYDGAVSPAVSHSPGSGSPDTLRNTSECNFSLILSELSFEWKNPTNRLPAFIFMTVQAKGMVICSSV